MAESPITSRAQDFATWYQDVVLQGDMAEPAEIVKGCMVIKPNGYAVWERLQREFDDRFKATGHQNAYFPLLIPQSFLRKEAEHVEGFSPELAVVTTVSGDVGGSGLTGKINGGGCDLKLMGQNGDIDILR